MAQANVIAKVSSLTGEAFARDASGNLRRLQSGDVIREGETVVAGNGAEVVLTLADGRSLVVSERQSVTVDAEVAAEVKPDASDSALAQKNGFEKIAAALQEGEDLDALLDAEAPAAGETGPGNEGHSFVEFLRIVETVDPQSYSFGTGGRGVLNAIEGVPLGVVYGPISVDSPVINEASPYAVFTVTGDPGQKITLTLTDGSAQGGGVDYGPVLEVSTDGGKTWVTYPGGGIVNVTGTVLVRTPVVNDDLAEGDESFTLIVTPESGGMPATGTGTIKDDGTGDIQDPNTGQPLDPNDPLHPGGLDNDHTISVNNVEVDESAPHIVFTVTGKSGNQITLALADGTATAVADYGPQLEVSIDGGATWTDYAVGDKVVMPDSGRVLVRTPIVNDKLVESDEVFTLIATPALASAATGTGTIIDDDKPEITKIEVNGPGVADDAVVEGGG